MKPKIKKDPFASLTPGEKAELRAMLESPVYRKMISIVENFKPSPNCANAGSGSRDDFSNERANARLGEIRGWEMHEMALFAAVNTPEQVKSMVEENFPDSGVLGHDDRDLPEPKPLKENQKNASR